MKTIKDMRKKQHIGTRVSYGTTSICSGRFSFHFPAHTWEWVFVVSPEGSRHSLHEYAERCDSLSPPLGPLPRPFVGPIIHISISPLVVGGRRRERKKKKSGCSLGAFKCLFSGWPRKKKRGKQTTTTQKTLLWKLWQGDGGDEGWQMIMGRVFLNARERFRPTTFQ